jgi:hypothetical protein
VSPRRSRYKRIFVGECLNCFRTLEITITNECAEDWAGICSCGCRNIFSITIDPLGIDQKIEKAEDWAFDLTLPVNESDF